MKSQLQLFLLPALIAGLNLIPAGRVSAQTFTILHRFDSYDGFNPVSELIVSGNTLYGTTAGDGHGSNAGSVGRVFAINTNGTGFTNLHSFTATSNGTNSDGTDLEAGLILSGNTLYGTAYQGGSLGAGTVFAVNTNGTGFTNLHSFSFSDGYHPEAGLILSGNILYGTTFFTVFAVNTDGTGFTNLHIFSATSGSDGGYGTNSDGLEPRANLILSGGTLYGTAEEGGSSGNGTVFAVKTDGTGFTNLHNFTATLDPYYTNSDGAGPKGGLVLSGNTLYGTAAYGGSSGLGTVFAVNTNGTGFTNLHSFAAGAYDTYGNYTNSDGGGPNGLILSGNTLYGTAGYGGRFAVGTVFAVKTDSTRFTNLHNFGYGNATYPFAGLVLSGNALYGTASDYFGEDFGYFGTVFSLSFPPPQLTITLSGSNVILSWPANIAGFDYTGYALQSTTNLGSSAVWTTNPAARVVVDGQNTVTNPISGEQKFYRLSQ